MGTIAELNIEADGTVWMDNVKMIPLVSSTETIVAFIGPRGLARAHTYMMSECPGALYPLHTWNFCILIECRVFGVRIS